MPQKVKNPLVQKTLKSALRVHKFLGPGFSGPVYERALAIDLRKEGISFDVRRIYTLCYQGEVAARFSADLVIKNKVAMMIKAVPEVTPHMEAELLNYLKASGIKLGFIVNFHKSNLEWIGRAA